MTWAVARSTSVIPGLSDLWSAVGMNASELQHVAANLGDLANNDPAKLARDLHDLLTTSPATRSEVVGIIAPNMNDAVLDALGQLQLGREVVRLVHTACATTSFVVADPCLLDRLSAAIAAFAEGATAAGRDVVRNVLGESFGAPLLVQSLLPQGRSSRGEDRVKRDRDESSGTSAANKNDAAVPGSTNDPAADAMSDVAGGFLGAVESLGNGIEGAVANVERGAVEATVGVGTNLLECRFGEASASMVRGADHAIFQSTENLCLGVRDGAQSLSNGITDAAGPVGTPIRWVTDRLFDTGNTVVDTAFGISRDLFRIIPDACIVFIGGIEGAVKLAIAGDWAEATGRFGMAFVAAPARVIGGCVDMLMRGLQCIASVAQTMVGAEPPARKLTADERAYLERIYGDSVDYDKVRVKPGGPLNDAMAAHTVGNTIYMPSEDFNPDGTLTDSGLQTLGHEVGHVWQNQNGGGDYIHNALWAQLLSFLGTGDRSNAYDWRQALAEGQSFETMNDEQRARVMEDIGVALQDDGQVSADEAAYGEDYTQEEIAFLVATAEELKAGEGAS